MQPTNGNHHRQPLEQAILTSIKQSIAGEPGTRANDIRYAIITGGVYALFKPDLAQFVEVMDTITSWPDMPPLTGEATLYLSKAMRFAADLLDQGYFELYEEDEERHARQLEAPDLAAGWLEKIFQG
jgi:hypothetical protein